MEAAALYLIIAALIGGMLWVNHRQDKRIGDILDRNMHLTELLTMQRNMDTEKGPLYFQDLETGEMTPLFRGDGAGVEDVEGAMPSERTANN